VGLELLFRAPRCLNSVHCPFCKATLRDTALAPALRSERTNERTNDRPDQGELIPAVLCSRNKRPVKPAASQEATKENMALGEGSISVSPAVFSLTDVPSVQVHCQSAHAMTPDFRARMEHFHSAC
jgi:hypothetical protein